MYYHHLKKILLIWSFAAVAFLSQGQMATEMTASAYDEKGFINFSIVIEEHGNIKLVNQSVIPIQIEIFGVVANKSTTFEIFLINAKSENATQIFWQEEYNMSTNGRKTVEFPIKGENFGDFGRYAVKFVACLQNSSKEKESVAFTISYNEMISQVNITCPHYIRIGSLANFTANVEQRRHRLGLSWNWVIYDMNINKTIQTNDTTSQSTQQFNISKAGNIEILITVSNDVSSSSNSCRILSLNPINGYELYSSKAVYSTTETALFRINTTTTKLPVGLVNLSVYLPVYLPRALNNTNVSSFEFKYNFTKQGRYTVLMELRSEIDAKNISKDVQIWDELDQLKVKPSTEYARVGERVNISLQNPPPSAFHYIFSFGDGSKINKTSGPFNETFMSSSFEKNYSNPGMYKLCISAWNEKYNKTHLVNVYIQHPILHLNITPEKFNVPLPDGIVDFVVTHSEKPLPTNVTCKIDYYDGSHTETELHAFNFGFTFRITFRTPGQYTVNVTCQNEVSSYGLEAYVDVTEIKMSDISYVYQNPSPMNMSRNSTFPFEPFPVSTNVTFKLVLFNCSRLPHDLNETWEIISQSYVTFYNRTDFTRILTFNSRQTFDLKVLLEMGNDNHQHELNITMGIIELFCNKTIINLQKESFHIKVTVANDLNGETNTSTNDLTFEILEDKPGETQSKYLDTSTFTLNYTDFGFYMPRFTARGINFIEEIYLDYPLIADYDLQNKIELHTTAEANNDIIYLPPGNINYVIRSVFDKPLPFVNCTFCSGDEVNRVEYYVEKNITDHSPLEQNHTYTDLGNQTIEVKCKNFISRVSLQKKVAVINTCFGDEGIFERRFSMKNVKMKITDASEVYIVNRMSVFSINENIYFHWKNCESLSTRKGVCLFNAKGTLAGVIEVVLNVSVPTCIIDERKSYISEPMFIEILPSIPVAYIIGGELKYVHLNDNITFQGMITKNNRNSNYEWAINSKPTGENNAILSYQFNTIDDFNVTLKVNGSATFMQRVSVLSKTAIIPVKHLRCIVNCVILNNISPQTKLALASECTNCSEKALTVNYSWSVFEENQPFNLTNKTLTGISGPDFSLKEGTLNPEKDYKIVLTVGKENYITPYNLTMVLKTSKTGQDIFNGFCNATFIPEKTAVSAMCKESLTNSRVVFSYLFETITRRWTAYGEAEDVINYLYKGYEGSIYEVPIQVGDDKFENNVTLRIRIFNENGDFWTFMTVFQNVRIPSQYFPTGIEDVKRLENLFRDFNKTVSYIRAGGDTMRTFRYVGSVASMFAKHKRNESVTTEEDILKGAKYVKFYKESPTEKKYKEVSIFVDIVKTQFQGYVHSWPITPTIQIIISHMIEVLTEDSGSCTKENYIKFSLIDIQQIFSSIGALVREPSYISLDMLENNLIELVENMTECFTMRVDETMKPLPNDYIEPIIEIMKHIVRIVNVIVDVMLPTKPKDYSIISLETIETGLRTKKLRSEQQHILIQRNLTDRDLTEIKEKSQLLMKLYEHENKTQEIQKKIAEIYFHRLQDVIMSVQSVVMSTMVLGEQMEFHQQYLKVLMKKITIDVFKAEKAANLNYQQFVVDINNTSPHSVIEVKICVFGKNPLIYSYNASSLTSDVLVSNFGNGTVVDVKLENKGIRKPYKFTPLYSDNLDEKITHFYFDVENDDDAILIYLKPEDFDINDIENRTMYWVYVSQESFPTTSSVMNKGHFRSSVRNWDSELGYKIFVPAKVCPSGICYLGIKPIEVDWTKKTSFMPLNNDRYNKSQRASDNKNTSYFDPEEANFTLQIITTACRSWNKDSNTWDSENCQVLPMTTIDETLCRCTGHIFSTTFNIPLNLIDLYHVWDKFDAKNASVYGTIIALLVIYIVLAVILRREDMKDIDRWSVSFLSDHDADDSYFYKITVFTGLRRHAGTTSNIFFVLSGSQDDSRTRSLHGGVRKGLSSGSIVTFVFGTRHNLGDLEYIRIWHDSSGEGSLQDWYLNKIEITDLQTDERVVFLCETWLSLTQEDGQIERLLPVSTIESLTTFKTLLAQQAQINVTEHHLWLSLLLRPQRSRFTRVQRLSCLMALLFLSMISNAMFYKSNEEAANTFAQIGVFRISPTTLFVSLIGIVITTFPILFITVLFRNRQLRQGSLNIKGQLDKKEKNDEDVFAIPETYIKEQQRLLPYWIVYVAWIMLTIIVAVSAFFLLLYSMEWGSSKSEEWLSSFILSFLESITLIDPIKVCFVAVLFATVFKTIIYDMSADIDLDHLKELSQNFKQSSTKQFAAFASSILKNPIQLTQEDIDMKRAKRQQEKRAKKALTKLVISAVYLSALYSISYLERDDRSFDYKSNIENYLDSNGHGKGGFSSIKKIEDFINWLNKTFVPTMYPETNYANRTLSEKDKQMFKDDASVRVGPAQLRQLRTVPAEYCSVKKITWPYPCIHGYENEYADTAKYCEKWKPYEPKCAVFTNLENRFTAGAWKYTNAESIWGTPKTGEYGTYDGGGYILRFTKDKDKGQLLIKDMIEQNWIDRHTRAIFVEFTLYNANSNLFVHAIYLTEFLETGGIAKWTEIQAFRPILNSDMVGNFTILCYTTSILFILITTVQVIFNIKLHGGSFFLHPWSWVIFLTIFLGYVCVAVYIVRTTFTKEAMQLFYDKLSTQEDKFINFNHIIIWDNIFNAVFATLVFLSTLQLLNILGYNKRFTQIISVVVNAGSDIGGFGFIFLIIYVMFVVLGTLLFGVQLRDYRDLLTTCGTLANSFIGKNNVRSMVSAVPTFAEFFYVMYMFCVIMTLITIFAAILNNSISHVKATLSDEFDKIGIKFYISKTIKDIFGMVLRTKAEKPNLTKGNKHNNLMSTDDEVFNIIHLLSRTLHGAMGITGEKNGNKYMETKKCESNETSGRRLQDKDKWKTNTENNRYKRDKYDHIDEIALKFF